MSTASTINESYDTIVIGAGVAGLTAGLSLARAGLSVLVAEQGPRPGGCCTSFAVQGFTFDYGIDTLRGLDENGPVRSLLNEMGLAESVEFAPISPAARVTGDSYDIKIHSRESFEDRLVELFPMESEGIHQLMKECRHVAADMERLCAEPPAELQGLWQRLMSWWRFSFSYADYKKYRATTAGAVVSEKIGDARLRAIIHTTAPELDPGVMANLLMWRLGSNEGAYYPRGGAQALVQALATEMANRGGHLALGAAVDKILVEQGAATGVELAGGKQVKARFVIAAGDARHTYNHLLQGAPAAATLNEARTMKAPFIVSLGVDLDLAKKDFDGSTILYAAGETLEDLFGSDPEKCILKIMMHSIANPAQAPAGASTVQLVALLPYDYAANWDEAERDIAAKLIAAAEKVIPELKGHITFQQVISPRSHERMTLNSQGSLMGWYPGPDARRLAQKSSVRNLYHAGHWTWSYAPCRGIDGAMISGQRAAALVLKNINRK